MRRRETLSPWCRELPIPVLKAVLIALLPLGLLVAAWQGMLTGMESWRSEWKTVDQIDE